MVPWPDPWCVPCWRGSPFPAPTVLCLLLVWLSHSLFLAIHPSPPDSTPTWCIPSHYAGVFSLLAQNDGIGKVACWCAAFSKESLWRLKRLLGKYSILAQFSLSRHISFQKITSYRHNHVIAIFQAFSFCACVFYIWVKSHPPQAIGTKLSWELNVPNKRKLQRES